MISPATNRLFNLGLGALALVLAGNSVYESALGNFSNLTGAAQIVQTVFIGVGYLLAAGCLLAAFTRGCQSLLQTVLGYMSAYAVLALFEDNSWGLRLGNAVLYTGIALFAFGLWLRKEEETRA